MSMYGNGRMTVNVHRYQYENDRVYLTMGVPGGYAVRNYLVDGKDIFTSNQAFFNVLTAYWNLAYSDGEFDFTILPSALMITVRSTVETYIENGKMLLDMLLNTHYDEALFASAKAEAKEVFAKSYKNEVFRARCKAFEVTEYNKDFSLGALIRDYEEITFAQFQQCGKMLLIPDNICIHISGNVEEKPDLSAWQTPEVQANAHRTAVPGGVSRDLYLREDLHIVLPARNGCNCSALAVDFLNDQLTHLDRFFFLSMLAEWIPLEIVDTAFDRLDASIFFSNELLRPVKPILKEGITEEAFLKAQKSLVGKYLGMIKHLPDAYGVQTVWLMLHGIDILHFIKQLQSCSYEQFVEGWKTAKPIFTEAQVIMRKEQVGHVQK